MNHPLSGRVSCRSLLFIILGAALPLTGRAAASDISPVDKRRVVVETATQLSKPGNAAPLPENLALPFSPPGFNLSEAQERAAATAAANGNSPAAQKAGSDREILEELAAKLPSTGTMFRGGEALLTFGQQNVKIGTRFKLPLNGQEYEVELIKIDPTSFTLRFNREEITRPIKPAAAKSP
jgi:hypothetical protein